MPAHAAVKACAGGVNVSDSSAESNAILGRVAPGEPLHPVCACLPTPQTPADGLLGPTDPGQYSSKYSNVRIV